VRSPSLVLLPDDRRLPSLPSSQRLVTSLFFKVTNGRQQWFGRSAHPPRCRVRRASPQPPPLPSAASVRGSPQWIEMVALPGGGFCPYLRRSVGHGYEQEFLPAGWPVAGKRWGCRHAFGQANTIPAHTRPAAIPMPRPSPGNKLQRPPPPPHVTEHHRRLFLRPNFGCNQTLGELSHLPARFPSRERRRNRRISGEPAASPWPKATLQRF
jgi:hypothetical protein